MYKKFGLFVSLLLLFFSLNVAFFGENSFVNTFYFIFDRGGVPQGLIYFSSVLFSLIALSLLIFQKNKLAYFFTVFFLGFFYLINLLYNHINGEGFSYDDFRIIVRESDKFALDAILTFLNSFYFALTIVMVMLVIVFFIRKIIIKNHFYLSSKIIYLPLLFSILGTYSIMHRTAGNIKDFPAPLRVVDTMIYYALNKQYYGERDILELTPLNPKKFKNIIWIVDESVGGKYFSINGYHKDTTPFLSTLNKFTINLGLASSGANTSVASNLILESGIQLKDLPDKSNYSLRKSSIYQYAKNAGYTTSYISGQSYQMVLQNGMSSYDLKYIDNFHQPAEPGAHEKEIIIPEEGIIEHVNTVLHENNKANFIYIVKSGVHFHYEKSYPDTHKVFVPTLTENEAMSMENEDRIINSYLNGIRWKVDDFFKYFFQKTKILERDDTIIIYTSDHGQSILENDIRATHSTASNPPLSQGVVPFLLFLKNKENLEKEVVHLKNNATHYMIFPTTLKWMGYETKEKTFEDKEESYHQEFYHGNLFGIGSEGKTSIKR